jgi:serine/threonine protein kinase/Tfp pilus assembly protein PilF
MSDSTKPMPAANSRATTAAAHRPGSGAPPDSRAIAPVAPPDVAEWATALVGPPRDDVSPACEHPTEPHTPTASPDAMEAPVARGGTVPGEAGCAVAAPAGPGRPQVPGYEILGELGRGGMGVVYRARDLRLGRLVALKMVRTGAHTSRADLLRFRGEAEAVARLKHPHIVQVYEVGEADGMPFIALEYVEGGGLDRVLKALPLSARDAALLVEALARAMQHAHEHGIVHRDLKPGNILLESVVRGPWSVVKDKVPDGSLSLTTDHGPRATDLFPKVTDFGLAKRLDHDSGQTCTGMVMGTPSYMAPEQAAGENKEVGPAADVYALGAILYDALVGRPPFKAATDLETVRQVLYEEPIPPRRLQPDVPRDLETVCLKCLEKEPERRYASAAALGDDLRRFLGGETIQARPAHAWERLGKWTRRKPALASLVGMSLLAALAVAASVVFFGLYHAQQARLYQQQLAQVREQEEVLEQARRSLTGAQKREAAGEWAAAKMDLLQAQSALDARPGLPAGDLAIAIHEGLERVETKLRERQQQEALRKRRVAFWDAYHQALGFYTLRLTGLGDAARSRDRALKHALEALELAGLVGRDETGGGPQLLGRDHPQLGGDDGNTLHEACYELLLIWAEVESPAGPGGADGPKRAETALGLLAAARRLGPPTRTYRLLKARFDATAHGVPFDRAAAETADSKPPQGRLDWFLTGLEKHRQGRFGESIAACDEVLKLDPRDYWPRYVKALSLVKLRRHLHAKAELTACLVLREDFVWPRLLRGYSSTEAGFAVLRTEPVTEGERKLAAAEFRSAEQDLDAALAQDPDPVVQYVGLNCRGVLNVRRGRWQEAVSDLSRALEIHPDGLASYLTLSLAYYKMGRWDKALEVLDRAVARAPDEADVYEFRAKVYWGQKRWALARADFEQAVALLTADANQAPRLANTLLDLGQVLHEEGRYEAALDRYRQALDLVPKLTRPYFLRARALIAMKGQQVEAAKALDTYLARDPAPPPEAFRLRGHLHSVAGELPGAIKMYSLCVQSAPEDTETLCRRGWAYLAVGALPLALQDFEGCVGADATRLDGLLGRGNVHGQMRQLQKALDDAQAVEAQAADLDALQGLRLARIYALAAGLLSEEARTAAPGEQIALAKRLAGCKRKAIETLVKSQEALPEAQWATFWHDRVSNDPAFAPVRGDLVHWLKAAGPSGGPP